MNRSVLTAAALTLPLLIMACTSKDQKEQVAAPTSDTQAAGTQTPATQSPAATPAAPTAASDTIQETLLASARQQTTTSQNKICLSMPFGDKGTDLITLYKYNQNPFYAQAVKAGYFTTETGPPFRLKTTGKYDELISHSANSDSYIPKLCVGNAEIQSLNSVRQLNPDKYSARGVMKLNPEPWVTPEMLALFGGGSQGPLGRELSLLFRRVDGAWQAERF